MPLRFKSSGSVPPFLRRRTLLKAYFPSDAQLILLAGGRDIEQVDVGVDMPPLEEALSSRIVAAPDVAEKIVVFCNARKRVVCFTSSRWHRDWRRTAIK